MIGTMLLAAAIVAIGVQTAWHAVRHAPPPGRCHMCGCAVGEDERECDDCWSARQW